jgi:hypothetical protein
VAVLVVDRLQAVHVGKHQAERHAVPVCLRQTPQQVVIDRPAVAGAGQWIEHRQLLQLAETLLLRPMTGGFSEHLNRAHNPAFLAHQRSDPDGNWNPVARTVLKIGFPHLHLAGLHRPFQQTAALA